MKFETRMTKHYLPTWPAMPGGGVPEVNVMVPPELDYEWRFREMQILSADMTNDSMAICAVVWEKVIMEEGE